MDDSPTVNEAEMKALQRAIRMDCDRIGDDDVIASLHRMGFIRPDGSDDWMITIRGHLAYLRALAFTF